MATEIISKRCSKCKIEKPVTEFGKRTRSKDGLHEWCKTCNNKACRLYSQTERGKTAYKRYRQSEKGKRNTKCYMQSEAFKESKKRYNQSQKGRENYRKGSATYRQNHPDRIRENVRRYCQSEKGRLRRQQYDQSAKGKLCHRQYEQSEIGRARKEQWRESNPLKIKAECAINNAIRAGRFPVVEEFTCTLCPRKARHWHHFLGYERKHWFDVIPVCVHCHVKIHRQILISAAP